MEDSFDCPRCTVMVFQDDLTCPSCSARLRYKTLKESGTWPNSGIFDLIPGIRDLPDAAKIRLRWVLVVGLTLGIIRLIAIGDISETTRVMVHLTLLAVVGLLIIMPAVRLAVHWIERLVDE